MEPVQDQPDGPEELRLGLRKRGQWPIVGSRLEVADVEDLVAVVLDDDERAPAFERIAQAPFEVGRIGTVEPEAVDGM